MSEESPQQKADRMWKDAELVLENLKVAEEYELQTEFMGMFIKFLIEGESVESAIAGARSEWDF